MPRWCDMRCEFAEFPEKEGADGSGSCRTFQAIFCAKLKQIVSKNARCTVDKQGEGKDAEVSEG